MPSWAWASEVISKSAVPSPSMMSYDDCAFSPISWSLAFTLPMAVPRTTSSGTEKWYRPLEREETLRAAYVPFIHSFSKYLLGTFLVPSTYVQMWPTVMGKAKTPFSLWDILPFKWVRDKQFPEKAVISLWNSSELWDLLNQMFTKYIFEAELYQDISESMWMFFPICCIITSAALGDIHCCPT